MIDTSKLNTTIDFALCDGRIVKLSLTFYDLYRLKSSDRKMYDKYNRAINALGRKEGDELDSITILYVAYYCANSKHGVEDLMNEEEFIIMCGSDRKAVNAAAKELTQPKRNVGFDKRS